MRLDELNADEFATAIAEAVEAVGRIKESKSGAEIYKDLQNFRGSIEDNEDANGAVFDWVVDTTLKRLPSFVRENSDAVYGLLAACDGITLEEYKATFTPAKLMTDARNLAIWATANKDVVKSFFA